MPHQQSISRQQEKVVPPQPQQAATPVAQTRLAEPTVGEPIQRVEAPNRTGLPDNLKSGIENLSGYSMDDVRVHYNSAKPAQLQAHAYAQGTDIHVAPGQEKHLPHETWHVVQQKQGRVKATRQLRSKVAINDDPKLEREADVMGGKLLKTKESIPASELAIGQSNTTPISQLTEGDRNQRQRTGGVIWATDPLEHMGYHLHSSTAQSNDSVPAFFLPPQAVDYPPEQIPQSEFERFFYEDWPAPSDQIFNQEQLEELRSQDDDWSLQFINSDTQTLDFDQIDHALWPPPQEHDWSSTNNALQTPNNSSIEILSRLDGVSEQQNPVTPILYRFANHLDENVRTTPEAGYPAILTSPNDIMNGIQGAIEHIRGEGTKLKNEARESAETDKTSYGDKLIGGSISNPLPNFAEAGKLLTAVGDAAALITDSARTWKAFTSEKRTEADRHQATEQIQGSLASVGVALLNAGKFALGFVNAIGGAVTGAIGSLAMYVRSLKQMGEAEIQFLTLRDIQINPAYPKLQELLTYLKGKKLRRTVKQGTAAVGSGTGVALGIGGTVATIIGGVGAAAALAVSPVGLVVGAIGLTIGVGLAGYKIYRWARQKWFKKGDEQMDWAKFIHERVQSRSTNDRYEVMICLEIIKALGLKPSECEGSSGLDNINNSLDS